MVRNGFSPAPLLPQVKPNGWVFLFSKSVRPSTPKSESCSKSLLPSIHRPSQAFLWTSRHFFATLGLTHEQIIRKHQSSTPDAVPMAINHLLLLAQFLLITKSDFSGGRYVRTTAPHQRSCFVIRFRSCDRVAIGLRLSRAFSLSCGRGFSPAAASLSLFPGPPATTLLSSVSLRQLAMLRRH